MGKKISIEIGENTFETKKEALAFYKEILNSYKPGDQLNDEDFELIFDLLKKHPNAKEKIGEGVEKIAVERDEYTTQCFHIHRIDKSIENFSYIKCINGEPNDFTRFSKACRKATEEDLKQVKQDYFKDNSKDGKVKCQDTNELIEFDDAHVDHRQPNTFSAIVDRFIELRQIDLKAVVYNKTESYGHTFVDSLLAADFRKYHSEKAKLRVVKKLRNMARSFQAKVNAQKKDLRIP